MNERHVYQEGENLSLCGRFRASWQGTLKEASELPLCPLCAARDAAARLSGGHWVACTGCRGSGHVARTDSPATSCFQCGNAGLYLVQESRGP